MSGPGEGEDDRLGTRSSEVADDRSRIVDTFEDQDDPGAFHISRGRPTASILPFAAKRRLRHSLWLLSI
jgi:hypothetical protein